MGSDKEKIDIYLNELSEDKRDALKLYYDILMKFNSRINLVAQSTETAAVKHHFADSFLGLKAILENGTMDSELYDFGSGNGFPGMIYGIMQPESLVVLVEKDQRKSEFLKFLVSEIGLNNVQVFPSNMENLPKQSIKYGVTRAMGSLSKMLVQTSSLFQEGGALYHFKSDHWTTELAQCPTAVFTKWDIQSLSHYMLPDSTIQRHVVISKVIS